MPIYQQRGSIPDKRHIQHYYKKNKLCYEEHISREGFSDIYSNVYHIHPPTKISKYGDFTPLEHKPSGDRVHRHHHLELFNIKSGGDWVTGRKYLLFNNDVVLSLAAPDHDVKYFYRNGHADEVLFIHYGAGTVESMFGRLDFHAGDYIMIPRGVIHQIHFTSDNNRMFIIESTGPVRTPKRYRNEQGQLLEHAPFTERDFRLPEFVEPEDRSGDHEIHLKLKNGFQTYYLAHHPFDLVGWDGYYFPWIFNIGDFMPITGKIHQPPPVHQTFAASGFVICSFVPRLFDYHEKSIPAPYAHSNLESDEILYYAAGDFMSRKGISIGSMTIHPQGIPHGPQPGRYEGSIGKKATDEVAVMLDTFSPLHLTDDAMRYDDPKYPYSWLE